MLTIFFATTANSVDLWRVWSSLHLLSSKSNYWPESTNIHARHSRCFSHVFVFRLFWEMRNQWFGEDSWRDLHEWDPSRGERQGRDSRSCEFLTWSFQSIVIKKVLMRCQVALAKNGTDKLNGTVVRVPGVKEIYDYEKESSNIPMPPGKSSWIFHDKIHKLIR